MGTSGQHEWLLLLLILAANMLCMLLVMLVLLDIRSLYCHYSGHYWHTTKLQSRDTSRFSLVLWEGENRLVTQGHTFLSSCVQCWWSIIFIVSLYPQKCKTVYMQSTQFFTCKNRSTSQCILNCGFIKQWMILHSTKTYLPLLIQLAEARARARARETQNNTSTFPPHVFLQSPWKQR